MQRRNLLKRIGTASTVTLGAAATAAASQPGPDGIADAEWMVSLDEDGNRVVLDISDVEDPSERDDTASTVNDCTDCDPYCCSQCPNDCYDRCGGCICADPGC